MIELVADCLFACFTSLIYFVIVYFSDILYIPAEV